MTPAYLRKIVDMLRENHDWVVVDLPSGLNDHTLGVLDAADQILVVAALEITTIKNVRLFLEVADQLDYERSKIRLVINRSDASQGIRIGDVEASIRRTIDGTIVSDGRLAVLAVNRGVPFVVSHPESPLARDVIKLARTIAGEGSHHPRPTRPPSADSSHAADGRTQPMSLLKRIERARPAAEGEATPAVPAAPQPAEPGGASQPPAPPQGGTAHAASACRLGGRLASRGRFPLASPSARRSSASRTA